MKKGLTCIKLSESVIIWGRQFLVYHIKWAVNYNTHYTVLHKNKICTLILILILEEFSKIVLISTYYTLYFITNLDLPTLSHCFAIALPLFYALSSTLIQKTTKNSYKKALICNKEPSAL